MPVEKVSEFGKFINEYGFLIIFGAIMLLAIGTAIFMFLRSWNKRESAKIGADTEKARVELELVQKERLANIEHNKQMYKLVTEVQSEQVSQMRNISDVITTLKDEVAKNVATSNATYENTQQMTNDMSGIVVRMDTISKDIQSVTEKVECCHQLETEIYDILNKMGE